MCNVSRVSKNLYYKSPSDLSLNSMNWFTRGLLHVHSLRFIEAALKIALLAPLNRFKPSSKLFY